MKSAIRALTALIACFLTPVGADARTIAVRGVTVIDVEDGSRRPDQTIIIKDGRIANVGPNAEIKTPKDAELVDGSGKFLIPGLWDMHVHSHREGRWKYHYPLFLAHGVIGVRDAGSHLGSALAAMEWTKTNPIAPHIIWGSPIIDGAPQINSFGLSAEDAGSARILVRELQRLGFDFVKSYDRLTPEAYFALADEAKKQKIPLEGHVPLSLTPQDAIKAGQTLIDHFTLVLEACLPGALDFVHDEVGKAPDESDSLALLMSDQLAAMLEYYKPEDCTALFDDFAARRVWQVPTLIEMRGYFHADDPGVADDPRMAFTTPALAGEWKDWSETADRRELANGKKVFAAQMSMLRAMRDAGVGILAGTDASSEPYVFAGAGVHDEMKLMVEAGLTPLEALQTATLNPLHYLGRTTTGRAIAKGETADLILLHADPLADIANTTAITDVFAHGNYFDRGELDALLETARAEAAKGGR